MVIHCPKKMGTQYATGRSSHGIAILAIMPTRWFRQILLEKTPVWVFDTAGCGFEYFPSYSETWGRWDPFRFAFFNGIALWDGEILRLGAFPSVLACPWAGVGCSKGNYLTVLVALNAAWKAALEAERVWLHKKTHHFFRLSNSSEVPSWWIWPTAPWPWPFHWNPWMLSWAFVRMPWHPWKATWGTKTGEELGRIAGVKVEWHEYRINICQLLFLHYTSYICFFFVTSHFAEKTGAIHFHPENLPGLQSRLSAAEAEAGPDRVAPEMVPWCQNRCIVDTSICRHIIYHDMIWYI